MTSIQTDDAKRTLTIVLLGVTENAHVASCGGLAVTEELFGSMHFRIDMAPDYKAWSCALTAAQRSAPLWAQFGRVQPQWAQLAKARSPRWTTLLDVTTEADVGARMGLAASERIGMHMPSEEWWNVSDNGAAKNTSWTAVLDAALQGMLCLLSDTMWTRLVAPAPWYWGCQLDKSESSPDGHRDGIVATDMLTLAHSELLRQLEAAVSRVTSMDTYRQDCEEQARLGAWSMKMQCGAGHWCKGLSETLQPLQQPACTTPLQGPGLLIHQKQLPSPSPSICDALNDESSWCEINQGCVVNHATLVSVSGGSTEEDHAREIALPVSGSGTEEDHARRIALQCTSCIPSKLECCVGGDRSALMSEFGLPDGRSAIIFQGETADEPAVLRLDNAEDTEQWKRAIHELQTSSIFLPDDTAYCKDTVYKYCVPLFENSTSEVGLISRCRREPTSACVSDPSA